MVNVGMQYAQRLGLAQKTLVHKGLEYPFQMLYIEGFGKKMLNIYTK